jgi:acyl-CoA thioesterase FadM
VLRNGAILARATVTLACLDRASERPVRIPAVVAAKMEVSA